MALDDAVDTAPRTDAASRPDAATEDLPQVFREEQWKSVYRHFQLTLIIAGVLGVLALVAGFLTGHPMAGAFGVIGLGLGSYNARRLWTDTTSLRGEITDARKQMGVKSLRRLGLVTLLAVLFAFGWRHNGGWAVFVGLVAFQLVMMTLLLKPLRHAVKVY
ncbi:MAG TPA: ATP synthase subunit I [Mycobacteriales bacterium]|nr:ATP synthase subunit I [Mycobacteriales bacterium]